MAQGFDRQGERMTTTPEAVFHYEVQKTADEGAGPATTIVCHGRVTSETSGQLKEVVKPLIPLGGRIALDLTDVSYMDSSGLGALVGLKVSALREGYCKLELVNLSQRVKELLRLSNLTQLFAS
jgi:anti-sigma B factor antagonist